MAKNSKTTNHSEAPKDHGADKTTRSDVASEANKAVDATRVNAPFSDNEEGKDLTADNAVELLTDNEISKRNRKVANFGTSREEK